MLRPLSASADETSAVKEKFSRVQQNAPFPSSIQVKHEGNRKSRSADAPGEESEGFPLTEPMRAWTAETLIDAYGDELLRLCLLYLGDRQLAEDAFQETMVKAWRALPGFRGESGAKTWLFHIAVNTCRDMLRSGWMRMRRRSVPLEVMPELAGQEDERLREMTAAVLALPDESILVDYRDYFTDEELAGYLPEFLAEGTVHDRLVILPLAKSTEILFVNKTAFDRFSAETGAALDELSTWEGLYAMAERYAEWSGGKSFFVHDYHFNYFQVGVESLGESFFDKDGIAFGPAFTRAWKPYARAALTSGLWLGSGYATEPLRTGDVIAAVASSASVLYYSDVVTYEDNRTEQVEILSLPCPVFAGGEKLVMQRGAGLCVVKSTPEREKACMTFLKWLNEPERNVDLATALGYMPVTKAGFDRLLPAAIETLEDPMYVSLYEAFLQTRQEYTFYVPPQREDYLSLETRFEKTARLRLTAGRAQYLEQGADALAPLLRTTLAEVQGSYDK